MATSTDRSSSDTHRPGLGAATPLWAVLALTWIGSLGTAVSWSGVFFVAEHAHGYDERENLALAITQGVAYFVAAFFARRWTSLLAAAIAVPMRSTRRASPRATLVAINAALACFALLPLAFRSELGVWLFGVLYTAGTGLLWPAAEAYVSGGRRGHALNRATGGFNLAWASALVAAMWLMVPLLDADDPSRAVWILSGMAAVHLACLALLPRFTRGPADHGEPAHELPPEERRRAARLLGWCRLALAGSYVAHAGLSPVLPQIMSTLELDPGAKPAVASIWMTTRLGAFALLMCWRGWHGSAWPVPASVAALALGLAAAAAAPSLAADLGLARAVLASGLAALGLGLGAVYAAAIYYALEVGTTDVDAGGKHEALIGLGYAVGPALALVVFL